MKRVLTIGDAMLDVLVKVDSKINFDSDTRAQITTRGGGAAANTASWLARSAVEADFFGAVGSDASGRLLVDELEGFGVNCHIQVIEGVPTGTVVVFVAGDGERTMFPDTGANSALRAINLPDPDQFAAILLSGYSLFNPKVTTEVREMIRVIRSKGVPLALDPASVGIMNEFGAAQVRSELENFEALLLNESEASFLSGQTDPTKALEYLLKLTPIVAIKRGSAGAIAGSRLGERHESPAVKCNVIDTTGAGDAFNAGFIATWVETGRIDAALEEAVSIAAQCVTTIGARPSVVA